MKRLLVIALLIFVAVPIVAQKEDAPKATEETEPAPPPPYKPQRPLRSRMYLGGWLGASASSAVDRIEAAPEIGFQITPNIQLGGSLVYRYLNDKRFEPNLTSTDLGGSLFGRYFVYAPFFLHLGVEHMSWEYYDPFQSDLIKIDANHTGVLIGPGFALSMGPRAATYFALLYDLNYDYDGPNPYDEPWVFRIGFGIGL
jgi:hypothetical protein